jgi:exopolyphosphatase / guanosine-5'-triphosphate,3'-diphosphate pyrophosphatase
VLGKAMRFGAMFSTAEPEAAGQLVWRPRKRELELVLTPLGQGLFGEVAQARFAALAQALRATPQIVAETAPA